MISNFSVGNSFIKEEEKKNFEIDTSDMDLGYINNSVASYMHKH
jgi:hypothetical protein